MKRVAVVTGGSKGIGLGIVKEFISKEINVLVIARNEELLTNLKSNYNTEQIEILIDAGGQYAIDGRSLVSTNIETLMKALETIANGDTTRPLVITADASTPHQAVISAMDAAGRLGFVHLSLTTTKPAGE